MLTRTAGTATVNPAVLATSNGHTGMDAKDELGSTSKGSFSGASGVTRLSFRAWVGSVMLGLVVRLVIEGWN